MTQRRTFVIAPRAPFNSKVDTDRISDPTICLMLWRVANDTLCQIKTPDELAFQPRAIQSHGIQLTVRHGAATLFVERRDEYIAKNGQPAYDNLVKNLTEDLIRVAAGNPPETNLLSKISVEARGMHNLKENMRAKGSGQPQARDFHSRTDLPKAINPAAIEKIPSIANAPLAEMEHVKQIEAELAKIPAGGSFSKLEVLRQHQALTQQGGR